MFSGMLTCQAISEISNMKCPECNHPCTQDNIIPSLWMCIDCGWREPDPQMPGVSRDISSEFDETDFTDTPSHDYSKGIVDVEPHF